MFEILKELQNDLKRNEEKILKDEAFNVTDVLQYVFFKNARELLNNYYVSINNNKIELTEIEYYYFNDKTHPDCSVHQDELQKKLGTLYVHKQSNNRGGLDITFGDNNYYGGILIRGIKHEGIYIGGPAKVRGYIIEKILNLDKDISYKELQEKLNELSINFEKKENLKNEDIYLARRQGINVEKYKDLIYRFLTIDYFKSKDTKIKNKEEIKAITYLVYDKYIDTKEYKVHNKIQEIKTKDNYKLLYENINKLKKISYE